MKILKIVIFWLSCSNCVFAYQADQAGFIQLPPWCKAKYAEMFKLGKVEGITINPAQYNAEQWSKKVGKPWVHFHHYCPAIMQVISVKYGSYKQYGKSKESVLGIAQSNINYTTGHSQLDKSTAWVFADAKMWLGKIAELQKKTDVAINLYKESISIYKEYIPAYTSLSDLYKEKREFDKASEWINKALAIKPNSNILKNKKINLEKKMTKN